MPNEPMRLAPAPSTDDGKLDGFVIAPTSSRTQRDARARAARASYEFWNTGDDAPLKRAFAENFADGAVWPSYAPATIGMRPNGRMAPEKESI